MRIRIYVSVIILCTLCIKAVAQISYSKSDSIIIENILSICESSSASGGELVMNIAKKFIGTPYVSGTLDRQEKETPTVNTGETDCTTFVETVTAMAITANENKKDFGSFCRNLIKIRYRNGRHERYSDRLHYISQWIADSAKRGIIEEINTVAHTATQHLELKFMSYNPQSYRQLANDSVAIKEIEEHEKPFRGLDVKYIPKTSLNNPKLKNHIKNGDIIAIVTAIDGLDVSHLGFAEWIDEELHLLHASSIKGKVISDPQTLYEYMANKKNHLGIRVFRLL